MSANNWSVCPKCKANEERRQKTATEWAAKKYGVVTPAEYMAMLEDAKPRELEETMREDYEIGVDDDGEFFVDYAATCQHGGCNFMFRFKHRQDATKEPAK